VTTEVKRAAARVSRRLTQQAGEVLEALVLAHLTRAILERAAALQPTQLRTLDAIHLATALDLEIADLTFISYDRRLLDAARAAGLRVSAPR
jgi:predicted nucleic acid-binding protein